MHHPKSPAIKKTRRSETLVRSSILSRKVLRVPAAERTFRTTASPARGRPRPADGNGRGIMNLHDIKAFVAVAETGSVNRAALRLNLTQPAMTRRLQNFEAAVGLTLLDRSTKPPALTPAGRQVLEHCRRILKTVVDLEAYISSVGEPAGDLRIGIAHGLAEVVLTSPIDDLRRRFPRLTLQISSNWTSRLLDEIRNGALDCAIGLITANHTIPKGVRVTEAGPERVVVVARRDTSFEGRVTLEALVGEGWVLNPAGCGCRMTLQRAFDRINAPMRIAAEVFGEDLQLSLIARSGGLGLVPWRQFEASPHRSRLCMVDVADFSLEATIAMLQGPSLGNLAAAVDSLREGVTEHLKIIDIFHNHHSKNAFESYIPT
ncbi:LysR family transcriptional regulator [Arenibaculum sp.]|uniref:LysR family transcriptional regulator n=1 Tax=Arenibaculum sp. TaxID=2865862 RepID=UPI002E154A09|nr:LysR family transcriptional regulator [Arenibaculum sp.]